MGFLGLETAKAPAGMRGFPFLLCCLTALTNGECRTGFDMAVKVRPEFRGGSRPGEG